MNRDDFIKYLVDKYNASFNEATLNVTIETRKLLIGASHEFLTTFPELYIHVAPANMLDRWYIIEPKSLNAGLYDWRLSQRVFELATGLNDTHLDKLSQINKNTELSTMFQDWLKNTGKADTWLFWDNSSWSYELSYEDKTLDLRASFSNTRREEMQLDFYTHGNSWEYDIKKFEEVISFFSKAASCKIFSGLKAVLDEFDLADNTPIQISIDEIKQNKLPDLREEYTKYLIPAELSQLITDYLLENFESELRANNLVAILNKLSESFGYYSKTAKIGDTSISASLLYAYFRNELNVNILELPGLKLDKFHNLWSGRASWSSDPWVPDDGCLELTDKILPNEVNLRYTHFPIIKIPEDATAQEIAKIELPRYNNGKYIISIPASADQLHLERIEQAESLLKVCYFEFEPVKNEDDELVSNFKVNKYAFKKYKDHFIVKTTIKEELTEDNSPITREEFKTYINEKYLDKNRYGSNFDDNTWYINCWYLEGHVKSYQSCLDNFNVSIQFDSKGYRVHGSPLNYKSGNYLLNDLLSMKAAENLKKLLLAGDAGFSYARTHIDNANVKLYDSRASGYQYAGGLHITIHSVSSDWTLRLEVVFNDKFKPMTNSWYKIDSNNEKGRPYNEEEFDRLMVDLCDIVDLKRKDPKIFKDVIELNNKLENIDFKAIDDLNDYVKIKTAKRTSIPRNIDFGFDHFTDILLDRCEEELRDNDIIAALKKLKALIDNTKDEAIFSLIEFVQNPLFLSAYFRHELNINFFDLKGSEEFINVDKDKVRVSPGWFYFSTIKINNYLITKDWVEAFPDKLTELPMHIGIVFDSTITDLKNIRFSSSGLNYIKMPPNLVGDIDLGKLFSFRWPDVSTEIVVTLKDGESKFRIPAYQYNYLKDNFTFE